MPVVAFVRSIPDHFFVMCPGDALAFDICLPGVALALGRYGGAFAYPAASDRIGHDLLRVGDHVACGLFDPLFVCHDPDLAPALCRHDCARNAHHAALLRETDDDILCTADHLTNRRAFSSLLLPKHCQWVR